MNISLGEKLRELMDENQDDRWNDFYGEDDGNLIDTDEQIGQYFFN